jgi:site-specific DNA-cytosine methylase
MKLQTTKFIVIDLFCGFGGTTTGFMQTNGMGEVV